MALKSIKKQFQTRLNKETIPYSSSDTLMKLLAETSKHLSYTPPAYLIASIITGKLTNFPTPLQVALGVLMTNSKSLVNQMTNLGITCSYDAVSNSTLQGISINNGLIQRVVDNFDADISSQNGKISTHSVAMHITQPSKDTSLSEETQSIRRLDKAEMTNAVDYEVAVEPFHGPKKADMPALQNRVLPLKVLVEMVISTRRARKLDFSFLKYIVSSDCCPEFNGYNTKLSREEGHTQRQKTNAVYLPLIDKTPSDPDTMNTALKQAKYIAKNVIRNIQCFLPIYSYTVSH